MTVDVKKNKELIVEVHGNRVPFYKILGLTRDVFDAENSCMRFPWKDEFMGNAVSRIMHGGVISAILDAFGGFILHLHYADSPLLKEKLMKVSTIDLRIDYLALGEGTDFVVSGSILRMGKKVAVVRSELRNDQQVLIAVGTGTYMVG
ncbi:MAG: thioesterase family protein [Dehalococcoidia bacterium]|nr:thioesterase family protein [Dehalococcoidia bacterium]